MNDSIPNIRKAFRFAFPYTIPIFAGFWFLGLTYGIYMNVSGFSFWYPCLMSLTIFAGSMEFVAVNLLLGAFNPLQALALTLMINARHLFYGISMLERYREEGAEPIRVDREKAEALGVEVVERPMLSTATQYARHSPDRLSQVVMELYEERADTKIF